MRSFLLRDRKKVSISILLQKIMLYISYISHSSYTGHMSHISYTSHVSYIFYELL